MAVKPVPEGFHTVTPYLTVADAAGQLAFINRNDICKRVAPTGEAPINPAP